MDKSRGRLSQQLSPPMSDNPSTFVQRDYSPGQLMLSTGNKKLVVSEPVKPVGKKSVPAQKSPAHQLPFIPSLNNKTPKEEIKMPEQKPFLESATSDDEKKERNNASRPIAIQPNEIQSGNVTVPRQFAKHLFKKNPAQTDGLVQKIWETLPEWQITDIEKAEKLVSNKQFPDGVYYGTLTGASRHGYGTLICTDFSLYEGAFLNNAKHGQARVINKEGSIIEGQWKKGLQKGAAAIKFRNDCIYEGEMWDCKPQGWGEFTHRQYTYTGQFQKGSKHGKGKVEFKDGSVFEGEFVKSAKQGKGKFSWPDGSYYDGDWENNQIQGIGEFKWANGESYRGSFMGSKRHGQGTMKYEDGSLYAGEWKNAERDGEGMIIYPDGTQTKGIWKDDELAQVTEKGKVIAEPIPDNYSQSNASQRSQPIPEVPQEPPMPFETDEQDTAQEKQPSIAVVAPDQRKENSQEEEKKIAPVIVPIPAKQETPKQGDQKSESDQGSGIIMTPMAVAPNRRENTQQSANPGRQASNQESETIITPMAVAPSRRENISQSRNQQRQEPEASSESPQVVLLPVAADSEERKQEESPIWAAAIGDVGKQKKQYFTTGRKTAKGRMGRSPRRPELPPSEEEPEPVAIMAPPAPVVTVYKPPVEVAPERCSSPESDQEDTVPAIIVKPTGPRRSSASKKSNFKPAERQEVVKPVISRPKHLSRQNKALKKDMASDGLFSIAFYQEFQNTLQNEGTVGQQLGCQKFIALINKFGQFSPYDEVNLAKDPNSEPRKWHNFGTDGWYYGRIDQKQNYTGLGILMSDTVLFEGNWKDGMLDQFGRYITFKEMYTGRYLNNQENGFGAFYLYELKPNFESESDDGISVIRTYIGDWDKAHHHGVGTFICHDFRYQGDFVHHKREGTGSQKFANGDIYKGDFYNDEISGFGMQKKGKSGKTYTGEWRNNVKHGQGVVVAPNGDTYTGNFANGKRQGLFKVRKGDKEAGLVTSHYFKGETSAIPDSKIPAANRDLSAAFDIQAFDLNLNMFSDEEAVAVDKAPVLPQRLKKEMKFKEQSKIANIISKHLKAASKPTLPKRLNM